MLSLAWELSPNPPLHQLLIYEVQKLVEALLFFTDDNEWKY